jgi:hypothetical protein
MSSAGYRRVVAELEHSDIAPEAARSIATKLAIFGLRSVRRVEGWPAARMCNPIALGLTEREATALIHFFETTTRPQQPETDTLHQQLARIGMHDTDENMIIEDIMFIQYKRTLADIKDCTELALRDTLGLPLRLATKLAQQLTLYSSSSGLVC